MTTKTAKARSSLRARLLGSLVLVAVLVLALAGGVTYLFVHGTAERAAVHDLQSKAPTVQSDVTQLGTVLKRAEAAATTGRRQPLRLAQAGQALRQIRGTLRLSDARLVFLDSQGTVTPIADVGRLGDILSAARIGRQRPLHAARLRRPGRPPTGAVAQRHGSDRAPRRHRVPRRTAAGAHRAGLPTGARADGARADRSAESRAVPAFLIAGAAALLVCVALSLWLTRRLTRPLAAVEATARTLASGDLSARVALGDRAEDEIADVANALNLMASQLEHARGRSAHSCSACRTTSARRSRRSAATRRRSPTGRSTATIREARRRAAGIITSEARRLERLVRDLLDLSRLDSHQFSLHPRSVDAASVGARRGRGVPPARRRARRHLDASMLAAIFPPTSIPSGSVRSSPTSSRTR